jgi:hypothetical protein
MSIFHCERASSLEAHGLLNLSIGGVGKKEKWIEMGWEGGEGGRLHPIRHCWFGSKTPKNPLNGYY